MSVVLTFLGCASSINDSQFTYFSETRPKPKPSNFKVAIVDDKKRLGDYEVIGLATAKAYLLEVAIRDLKEEARKAGADALIDFKQEQKMSMDYLQDLFFVEATAVKRR